MNKIKQLFIIGLCLALTLTTTPIVGNWDIEPYKHHQENTEKK